MKKIFFTIRGGMGIFAIVFLFFLFAPHISEAHEVSLWPTGYWGNPLVSCTGDGSGGQPVCTSLCDLLHTMQHLIYFGLTLVIFVFAPIFLAYGGILMLIAGANEGLWSQGKKVLSGTAIGIVLALGSFLIVNTLLTVFGQNSGAGTIQFGNISCTPGNNAPPEIPNPFVKPNTPPATGN